MTIEDLEGKTLDELKSIAYDQILEIQRLQNSLQIVQSLIKNKMEAKSKEKT